MHLAIVLHAQGFFFYLILLILSGSKKAIEASQKKIGELKIARLNYTEIKKVFLTIFEYHQSMSDYLFSLQWRTNLPVPPPPFRIKWSSLKTQMNMLIE